MRAGCARQGCAKCGMYGAVRPYGRERGSRGRGGAGGVAHCCRVRLRGPRNGIAARAGVRKGDRAWRRRGTGPLPAAS
ncbi:conserved hypothetical protein [Streptomyces sp. SPB78]|nr:conserved hypothetical protein [Streptomyces sp. SPB78]